MEGIVRIDIFCQCKKGKKYNIIFTVNVSWTEAATANTYADQIGFLFLSCLEIANRAISGSPEITTCLIC